MLLLLLLPPSSSLLLLFFFFVFFLNSFPSLLLFCFALADDVFAAVIVVVGCLLDYISYDMFVFIHKNSFGSKISSAVHTFSTFFFHSQLFIVACRPDAYMWICVFFLSLFLLIFLLLIARSSSIYFYVYVSDASWVRLKLIHVWDSIWTTTTTATTLGTCAFRKRESFLTSHWCPKINRDRVLILVWTSHAVYFKYRMPFPSLSNYCLINLVIFTMILDSVIPIQFIYVECIPYICII